MQIFEGAVSLELTMEGFGGNRASIHPVLLWGADGATLIDTGFPGTEAALEEALQRHGQSLSTLTRVIVTHQDIDHIGNLPAVAKSGAEVLAHPDDIPYIEGDLRPIKMNPERLRMMAQSMPPERRAQVEALAENPPRAKVNTAITDGTELPIHGGIRVIHTPGHTPGHVCLYFPAERVLLAADALRVVDGELVGPAPQNTLDMEAAMASLRKLPLDADYILCYHGGLYGPGAGERLRAVAEGA